MTPNNEAKVTELEWYSDEDEIRNTRGTIVAINLTPADAAFIVKAVNAHDALVDALATWKAFWDTMPKGQLGKLSFNVGLFNDGFVKTEKALALAEGRPE